MSAAGGGSPPSPPTEIELVVTTFLAPPVPGLSAWVQRARRDLLDPLVEDMQARAGQPGVISGDGEPGGCHVSFTVELADSLRTATYKYTESNWKRILEGLAQGRWRSVIVGGLILDSSGTPRGSTTSFELVADLRGYEWPGAAHLIGVIVSDDLAANHFRGPGQARLVALAKDLVSSVGATTGHLSRGPALLWQTPHEAAIGAGNGIGQDRSREWLRGFAWGNFLSETHVAKLGGRDRVLRDAPCAIVEELEAEGQARLYLQVTDDLWEVTEAQLDDLRAFFQPALLPEEAAAPMTTPVAPATSPLEQDMDAAAGETGADVLSWVEVSPAADVTSLEFTLELAGEMSAEQRAELERLLASWYEVGVRGGYGGYFHDMSGLDVEQADERTRAMWSMDFGSSGDAALAALARSLSQFARFQRLQIRALRVG